MDKLLDKTRRRAHDKQAIIALQDYINKCGDENIDEFEAINLFIHEANNALCSVKSENAKDIFISMIDIAEFVLQENSMHYIEHPVEYERFVPNKNKFIRFI